jgi:hypothetical protein
MITFQDALIKLEDQTSEGKVFQLDPHGQSGIDKMPSEDLR